MTRDPRLRYYDSDGEDFVLDQDRLSKSIKTISHDYHGNSTHHGKFVESRKESEEQALATEIPLHPFVIGIQLYSIGTGFPASPNDLYQWVLTLKMIRNPK